LFKVPNDYRIRTGLMGSDIMQGNNGAFLIPYRLLTTEYGLFCIASDGMDWEHVSITVHNVGRCPDWAEMCFIKNLFWDDTDTVIQFHPARPEYVNTHPHCLHLWRPISAIIPKPSPLLVGV